MGNTIQLIFPEQIVFETIQKILAFIKRDHNANLSQISRSMLFRILNQDLNMQRYNLYEQAISVFVTKPDNNRKLDVNYFFNMSRANIPTIHILFPSETTAAGNNGINIDEGFQDTIYTSTDYRKVYSRRFDGNVKIIITSDNTNEVVLIYHVLRALLIPSFNHLNFQGLEQLHLSGGDIQIEPIPNMAQFYSRQIDMSFSYDVNVQDFYDNLFINSIDFSSSLSDE